MSHNPESAEVDTAVCVCFAPPPVNQLLVVTSSSRLLKLNSHNGLLLSEVCYIGRWVFVESTSGLTAFVEVTI